MCKLFGICNFKSSLTKKQIKEISDVMSLGQRDGIGIAISKKGKQYIAKTTTTNLCDIFKRETDIGLQIQENYISLATNLKNIDSFFVHSRTSTNEKSLAATHPFLIDGTAFAHNGVVDIASKVEGLETSNDSEKLCKYWIYNNKSFGCFKNVGGYHAILALDNNNFYYCRDDKASLFVARVNNTFIFATLAQDLLAIAKILKLSVKKDDIFLLKDNTWGVISNYKCKIKTGNLPEKIVGNFVSYTLASRSLSHSDFEDL